MTCPSYSVMIVNTLNWKHNKIVHSYNYFLRRHQFSTCIKSLSSLHKPSTAVYIIAIKISWDLSLITVWLYYNQRGKQIYSGVKFDGWCSKICHQRHQSTTIEALGGMLNRNSREPPTFSITHYLCLPLMDTIIYTHAHTLTEGHMCVQTLYWAQKAFRWLH